MSEVVNVVEPTIRRPAVPTRKVGWATSPVPLIGIQGVEHQWIRMHERPLFGTFVDKPIWILVPDNWRAVYPPWQIEMLEKTYIKPAYITANRIVELNYAAFRHLCYEKDRRRMAWYLSYYGKAPEIRKAMLDFWKRCWEEDYQP